MNVFIFLLVGSALLWEGRISLLLLGMHPRDRLPWTLGYPLGALLNAFIFFVFHVIHVPFSALSLASGHGLFIVVMTLLVRRRGQGDMPEQRLEKAMTTKQRAFVLLLCAFLLLTILNTLIPAVTFPMFYWDSFAHWGLRANKSLDAGLFLIDGVIQPQFPVLMHTLQMIYAAFGGFSDQLVNSGTFLLSASAYMSVFLLVRRRTDMLCALVTLTILTGIPLVSVHLRQSMADIHVTAFALLSALLLDRAMNNRDRLPLILSALFVAAAAWTKFEGFYFALCPWLLILIIYAWRRKEWKQSFLFGALPAILVSVPWYLYVFISGMKLSPHGKSFGIHLEALPHIIEQLFSLGTFGMVWWAIVIVLTLLLWQERRQIVSFLFDHPSLLWGVMAFCLLMVVYIFTDEVRGLVRRDNFSRAMMLPTILFTVSLTVEAYRRWWRDQSS